MSEVNMHPDRFSVSVAFLLMVFCGTFDADAASACLSNVAQSTPTADFTLSADGTVTHNKTGLMWKQCAEGLMGAGCNEGGAMGGGAATMNWTAALSAAATPFAGYSDWRLPSQKELGSIVEIGCWSPSINETVFPATPSDPISGITSNNFWSSTSHASSPTSGWLVNFHTGFSSTGIKSGNNYVRLVRNGQPLDSFDVNKKEQNIIFGAAPILLVGATGTVSASGGASGNPVALSSTTASVCTISGGTVTGVTAGTCTIAANQAGNASFNAAPQVTQSFAVTLVIHLNDTGQDRCYDGSTLLACSVANSGNATSYPRQDGRFGRDAATAAGQLSKTGAGAKGFDFTRVCMSGELAGQGACPAIPVQGTGATQWACTKDNVTKLTWSLESYAYNWTQASTTYPAAMNTANRCGYNTGWRLPTRRELLSIVHNGTGYPAIDITYFPGTDGSSISSLYWSANLYVTVPPTNPALQWVVYFSTGFSGAQDRSGINYARLVRGGP